MVKITDQRVYMSPMIYYLNNSCDLPINICVFLYFFFKNAPTTEIYTVSYTLSLHDALPISAAADTSSGTINTLSNLYPTDAVQLRSEEHTSELQSQLTISYAVFCLKKK